MWGSVPSLLFRVFTLLWMAQTLVDIVWRFRGVLIMSAPPHLMGYPVECECLPRADLLSGHLRVQVSLVIQFLC